MTVYIVWLKEWFETWQDFISQNELTVVRTFELLVLAWKRFLPFVLSLLIILIFRVWQSCIFHFSRRREIYIRLVKSPPNTEHRSQWRARWPLDYHHGQSIWKFLNIQYWLDKHDIVVFESRNLHSWQVNGLFECQILAALIRQLPNFVLN